MAIKESCLSIRIMFQSKREEAGLEELQSMQERRHYGQWVSTKEAKQVWEKSRQNNQDARCRVTLVLSHRDPSGYSGSFVWRPGRLFLSQLLS